MTTVTIRPMRAEDATQVPGWVAVSAVSARFPENTAGLALHHAAVQALAALSLSLIGASAVIAVIAVTGFGLGFGVAGLASPVLLADRYGTGAYAGIAGALAAPVTLAKALAPLGASALATRAGHWATMTAIAAACALAAAGILARAHSPEPHDGG